MKYDGKTCSVSLPIKGGLIQGTFCLLLFLAFIFSSGAKAQINEKRMISLKVNNEQLSNVLKKVSDLSGAKIIYSTDDTQNYTVTTDFKRKTVFEALSIVLSSQPFTFSQKGEFIVITKLNRKVAEKRQVYTERTVSGRVVDNQKQPLIGVNVRIKNSSKGTITNVDGEYSLKILTGSITLVYSYIGMAPVELIVKPGADNQILKTIELKEDNSNLSEVVVLGIFNKARESYTGAATSFSRKQLEQSGNRSLVSNLRNLDPSFNIADNIFMGSDPNSLPTITIRGSSSLPTNVKDMKVSVDGQRGANQPLFILDGFEITLARFMDMDETQVENITILKDANATALYGSKGSNGVVLITSKKIEPGRLRFTYKGTLSLEVPDLASYNLMNSSEKLQYEKYVGLYDSPNLIQGLELRDLYNTRKTNVERGVDTYWMKYPIRTGVGSRHSLAIEGGDHTFRYGAGFSYNNVAGAMKGSDRNVLNGNISLQYKYKTLSFQESLQLNSASSKMSPYGSFTQYCALNAYHMPYDSEGNLIKKLENVYYSSLQKSNTVFNPLYDALLPSKNTNSYTSITNNLAAEWYVLPELFIRGQFSFVKTFNRSDNYVPADHSMFDGYVGKDYSRKGRYTYGSGESATYEGRLTVNYSKEFAHKHQVFAGFGFSIDESNSETYSVVGEGISVNNMDFLGMANQYMKNGRPTGNENISRNMGLLFNVRYTYDRRYFADLNGKYDGSSQFGSNNHFAPFWSAGLGWNIHQEKFLFNNKVLNIARFRASYGITGSQNFGSYLSMRTYQDYGGKSTQGGYGVYLMAMGNPDLKWQKSNQLNLGSDIEMFDRRLQLTFDVYNKITNNLLADVNLPISSGFYNYKSNVGKVENNGVEVGLTCQIIRDPKNDFRWSVGVRGAHNANKIKKISNSLQTLNEKLNEQEPRNPSFLFKEGESLNTIYAVRSKGIDPGTGNEVFVKLDGTETFKWDAKDKVACGVTDPKVQGSLSTNLMWKGVMVNLIFGYRLGGYAYNTTLANKVENINPYDNADRRVLYDRWKETGDISMFKSVRDQTTTFATSRFIFKDNTFYCSSMNVGYEFPARWVEKKLSLSYLALNGYIEDLFWASTIKRERGTDYPFARKFSLSLTARF